MTPTVPAITAAYAALLGLLGAFLTVRAIVLRVRFRVDSGDGGNAVLAQALRAHGNFAEQAPLALLLIALAEMLHAPGLANHALGVALVLARSASSWGLSHTLSQSPARQSGAGLTVLTVVASAALIGVQLLYGR